MVKKDWLENQVSKIELRIEENKERINHYQGLIDEWNVYLQHLKESYKDYKERLEKGEYDE